MRLKPGAIDWLRDRFIIHQGNNGQPPGLYLTKRTKTMRPDHLFVTASGDLYDTRKPIWNVMPPLREKFQHHFNDITTLARLKATIRAGEFSWPGGYRLAFVTQDGGILSFAAVRAEFKNVVWDFQNGASTGWRVVGLLNVDETEESIYCDHLNIRLNGDAEEDAA